MPELNLVINTRTIDTIDEIKHALDLPSTAAVIRKALALTRVVTTLMDDNRAIIILDPDGQERKIILSGSPDESLDNTA